MERNAEESDGIGVWRMFYNICVMSRLPQTASRKSTSSLEVCTYMYNLFSRDGSIPFTRLIDEAAFTNGCVTQRRTRGRL